MDCKISLSESPNYEYLLLLPTVIIWVMVLFTYFRFIVADRINEYRGTGGVRIEDDVIVHANHTELMSVVPRDVHTIITISDDKKGFVLN